MVTGSAISRRHIIWNSDDLESPSKRPILTIISIADLFDGLSDQLKIAERRMGQGERHAQQEKNPGRVCPWRNMFRQLHGRQYVQSEPLVKRLEANMLGRRRAWNKPEKRHRAKTSHPRQVGHDHLPGGPEMRIHRVKLPPTPDPPRLPGLKRETSPTRLPCSRCPPDFPLVAGEGWCRVAAMTLRGNDERIRQVAITLGILLAVACGVVAL